MSNDKESLGSKFIGLLFFVVGAYIGRYNWVALIVVGIGAVAFYWIASKFAKAEVEPMVPAIAVMGGHFSWFLLPLFISGSAGYNVLLDVVLLLIGIVWLFLRPGLGPLVLVILYEGASIVLNLIKLTSMEFDEGIFASFLLHLFLRISAIVLLVIGFRNIRKQDKAGSYWYYAIDDKQEGPITKEQLQQLIDSGVFRPDSLIWSENLSEWTPLKNINTFRLKEIVTPPPLPTDKNTNM